MYAKGSLLFLPPCAVKLSPKATRATGKKGKAEVLSTLSEKNGPTRDSRKDVSRRPLKPFVCVTPYRSREIKEPES